MYRLYYGKIEMTYLFRHHKQEEVVTQGTIHSIDHALEGNGIIYKLCISVAFVEVEFSFALK